MYIALGPQRLNFPLNLNLPTQSWRPDSAIWIVSEEVESGYLGLKEGLNNTSLPVAMPGMITTQDGVVRYGKKGYHFQESPKRENTAGLRQCNPSISNGLTAVYEKLENYYPINNTDCGDMQILYLATALHPKYKLRYFQLRESFPPALGENIREKLENLDNDFSDDKDNDVKTYLFETPKTGLSILISGIIKNGFALLQQLAKDIMAIPSMSVPAESFFSVPGDVIKKTRNIFFPANTKRLAVFTDMVRKMSPGDKEPGVESDYDNAGDDVELNDMIMKEIDDVSGNKMELDVAGAIEIN